MFFGVSNSKILKIFYNALLTGMPSVMNNPINKNILHAPFIVNSYSTYINYLLNDSQINIINDFLLKNENGLTLSTSSLLNEESKDCYLSINIYNCTSPLFEFISNKPATRCELNVYVKDKDNNKGTLIMDYESNILSMDPYNIFKKSGNIQFIENNDIVSGYVNSEKFSLNFEYNKFLDSFINNKVSSNLAKFSDKIYYPNGYYDKLYYDSSLIHNNIINCKDYNIYFNFLNMEFNNKDLQSVFYFENKINFVGGLWENLYDF